MYTPFITNTMKKQKRIKIVSLNKGIAAKSADTRTLSPLILEIVFKGLKTRKTLKPFKSKDEETS